MFRKAEKGNIPKRIPVVDHRLCLACGVCVGACPQNGITLLKATLSISVETCVGCKRCAAACPVGALSFQEFKP